MAKGKGGGGGGHQPEAEASLEAAAKSGSRKPRDQGLTAKGETAPKAASPAGKDRAAARQLKAAAEADTKAPAKKT